MSILKSDCGTNERRKHNVNNVKVLSLVVQKRREMAHFMLTKAFLQPSTTATLCCHLEGSTFTMMPIYLPTFLLTYTLHQVTPSKLVVTKLTKLIVVVCLVPRSFPNFIFMAVR